MLHLYSSGIHWAPLSPFLDPYIRGHRDSQSSRAAARQSEGKKKTPPGFEAKLNIQSAVIILSGSPLGKLSLCRPAVGVLHVVVLPSVEIGVVVRVQLGDSHVVRVDAVHVHDVFALLLLVASPAQTDPHHNAIGQNYAPGDRQPDEPEEGQEHAGVYCLGLVFGVGILDI